MLNVLPKEIRQSIYAHAFTISRPVTIKACCGPDKTSRERATCAKHAKHAFGRFVVLQTSKAVREEAAWVLFNQGSLHIDITKAIKPYVDETRSNSLRHISQTMKNKRKTQMWATASSYRFVHVSIPDAVLIYNDPMMYTTQLLDVSRSLCRGWEIQSKDLFTPFIPRIVTLELGTMFHEMLPFNMESQAMDGYSELLDWLAVNFPAEDDEPDFDKIAAESEKCLKSLTALVGLHGGLARWKVVVKAVDEKDKGGVVALEGFQMNCVRNGVGFEFECVE
jgi:hypothetical protein